MSGLIGAGISAAQAYAEYGFDPGKIAFHAAVGFGTSFIGGGFARKFFRSFWKRNFARGFAAGALSSTTSQLAIDRRICPMDVLVSGLVGIVSLHLGEHAFLSVPLNPQGIRAGADFIESTAAGTSAAVLEFFFSP